MLHVDDHATEYEFVRSSGTAILGCAVLGHRRRSGVPLSGFEMESWVLRYVPEPENERRVRVSTELCVTGRLTDLWQAPEGSVFVAGFDGTVRLARDFSIQDMDAWQSFELDANLIGLWGLSESNVFVWGFTDGGTALFRFDGGRWSRFEAPDGILAMHGTSEDLVVAVGTHGLAVRWDGRGWNRVPTGTSTELTRVHVVSSDELYAISSRGELFRGRLDGGWESLGNAEPILDVGVFEGDVWLAGGEAGLLRLDRKTGSLVCLKPGIEAHAIEVRDQLLVTAPDFSGRLVGGLRFRGLEASVFVDHGSREPPSWMPP